MKLKVHSIMLGLVVVLGMSSCSVGRHLGPNDHVLYRNEYNVEITDSTVVEKDVNMALNKVKNYAMQKPNKRLFGVRALMRLYCISNPEKDNWLQRFIRETGEEPILIDEGATQRTIEQIKTLLASKGCFNSQVTVDSITRGKYDMSIRYNIFPTKRYKIDEVTYRAETKEIMPLLNKWKGGSVLKIGECYDQDMLSKERDRIAGLLKDSGYYWANKDLITYIVDTTYTPGLLSIEVKVNNPQIATGERDLQKYNIGDVYIYPNSTAVTQNKRIDYDTLLWQYPLKNRVAHFKFLTENKMKLKPNTICRSLFIIDSTLFTPLKAKTTYNSLLNLKNFKYIGIEFIESPNSSDSSRLVDAHIRLQNNTRQKISISLEASNSSPFGRANIEENNLFQSGNIGWETILEYQNRNLFGGAELFKIDGSFLVELPKLTLWGENGKDFYNLFSSFEVGIDMSLDVPQFWLPFTKNIIWQRTRPHTMITLGANYQYRSYFERILTNASFGYNWQQSELSQHQLIPLEVAFVRFLSLDEDFMNRLTGASDLRLKYMYSDHFIMDAHYTYTYSTQKYGTRKNFNYLNASFESAGNLLNGLSRLTNGPVDTNGFRQIFKVPYAQYIKFAIDAKRYFYHGKKSTFVARLMAGVGIPYGNSLALPYEKSFFGGGPLSMRAWQLRHLGPGGYQPSKETIERMGDINIMLNLEERFPIVGVFEGAVFADIGNIWLMHESSEYPNGEWKWNRVMKEMAVGIGLGLRLNISIITLRLDFAIPLYDPGYPETERWRLPHWKFNQIVTNFGIDYPF